MAKLKDKLIHIGSVIMTPEQKKRDDAIDKKVKAELLKKKK
jgi:hypothetical protein